MNAKSQARYDLFVILAGTAIFGAIINRLLLALGLHTLVIRNVFVISISYGAFFIFVRMWLSHLKSNPELLKSAALHAKSARDEQIAKLYVSEKKKPSWWDALNLFPWDFGEFTIVLIAILLLLGVGIWVGVEGPMILIDAAFEVALSIGLIDASRKMIAGDWRKSVFERTIVPFILVLSISTLVLFDVQSRCPGRDRLSEVAQQCWFSHNHN